MKYISLLVLIILLHTSCSNELHLFSEEVIEPIITCMIDLEAKSHSVRVQKTYQKFEGSGYPDGNTETYFDDVICTIKGISRNDTLWEYEFSEQKIFKHPGAFNSLDHKVYTLNETLPLFYKRKQIDRLRLEIFIPELNKTYESETHVLAPLQLSIGSGSKKIQLYGEYVSQVSLSSVRYFDGLKIFPYKELSIQSIIRNIYNNSAILDTIHWTTNQGWEGGDGVYFLFPERIFNRIDRSLYAADTLVARNLISLEFVGRIPDLVFNEMYETSINRADRDINPFSNFNNGYGIFVCFSQKSKKGYTLDYRSMDSLTQSPKWKHLKFKPW